jgi:hypothetical protein
LGFLAAVVVALSASSSTAAQDPRPRGGAVVVPSNGIVLADWYKTLLELPPDVNPLWGTGEDPCVRFGPHGKLPSAISLGEVTCTAELGTVLDTGASHFCSDSTLPTARSTPLVSESNAGARAP